MRINTQKGEKLHRRNTTRKLQTRKRNLCAIVRLNSSRNLTDTIDGRVKASTIENRSKTEVTVKKTVGEIDQTTSHTDGLVMIVKMSKLYTVMTGLKTDDVRCRIPSQTVRLEIIAMMKMSVLYAGMTVPKTDGVRSRILCKTERLKRKAT